MTRARIVYWVITLFRNLLSLKAVSAFLSSFGTFYAILFFVDYFQLAKQSKVQPYWWVFLIAGVGMAVYACLPKLSVQCKLKDRDVSIKIAIGDLFSFKGALIVGTNTTFDTRISRAEIDEFSVQGQFTRKYYGDHTALDVELRNQLAQFEPEILPTRNGKNLRYGIGTIAKLIPKGRTGYFVAICDINEHGIAGGTFDDLKQALAQLWIFIGNHAGKEPIIMPVLGSRFMRLKPNRQVITQEIIKSFIAACSEKTFCEELTIVLAEKDVRKSKVDLQALGDYLRHLCTYTEFAVDTTERIGTPATIGCDQSSADLIVR